MTDPLSLLPLAAAAGDEHIDHLPTRALVAAGLTLLQRSAPLVRALVGKRAAILLPTCPQYLTALAASEGRGAVLMNPLAAPLELAYQLADAAVGAVFTTEALAAKLPPGTVHVLLDDAPQHATVVDARGARRIDLGSHFAHSLEGDPDAEGSAEEAAIVYTSAMYGRPLGAILTHRNLLANARATVRAMEIEPPDLVLAALPFAHLFGLVVSGIAPLVAGANVGTMPRFHPLRAVEALEQGTTVFVGVPAMYLAILSTLDRRGARLRAPRLRLCICGGAALDPAVQDRWFEATGVELRQGYGLTEASPVVLFNRLDLPNARGTIGVPYPGVEVSIRDPDGDEPWPDGETGEICMRGPTVFAGYVTPPGAAATPHGLVVRHGWLRTGDLGRRNADGTVVFAGLCKPMFTRNGFNIYPRELEAAVRELPGVAAATVRPLPDPVHENGIVLTVRGDVDESAVRAWCARRLSLYKQPTTIVVER